MFKIKFLYADFFFPCMPLKLSISSLKWRLLFFLLHLIEISVLFVNLEIRQPKMWRVSSITLAALGNICFFYLKKVIFRRKREEGEFGVGVIIWQVFIIFEVVWYICKSKGTPWFGHIATIQSYDGPPQGYLWGGLCFIGHPCDQILATWSLSHIYSHFLHPIVKWLQLTTFFASRQWVYLMTTVSA